MPGEAKPSSVTQKTGSPALDLSRRDFVASVAASGFALVQGSARAAIVRTDFANLPPYGNGTLSPGIRSRPIANVNGLTVHILEAGYEVPGRPAVLLLHGFPELAYSWRKIMLPLAAAGYHVIAPDQRGYGRTIGWYWQAPMRARALTSSFAHIKTAPTMASTSQIGCLRK